MMFLANGIGTAAKLLWAGVVHSPIKILGGMARNPDALNKSFQTAKGVANWVPFGKWGALGASGITRGLLAVDTVACFLQDTRRQREIVASNYKQNVSRQAASDATWWSSWGLGALSLSALKLPALREAAWKKAKTPNVRGLGALTTVASLFCLAKRYIVVKGSIESAFDPSFGPSLNGPMLMVDDPSSDYDGYSTFLEKSVKTRAMEDATWGEAGQKYRNMIDPYVERFGDWMYGANPPPGYTGVA